MRKLTSILAAAALLALLGTSSASADFGLKGLDVTFTNQDGSPAMQAGSHPFAMTTSFAVNTIEEGGIEVIDGAIRNLDIFQPAGFVGNPTAVPRCEKADFLTFVSGSTPSCANSTAVGVISVTLAGGLGIPGTFGPLPVYNLTPDPGSAAKLGFAVSEVPITIDLGVNPEPPYDVVAKLANISQVLEFLSSKTTVWGNPADPAHDKLRGNCLETKADDSCPAGVAVEPFLTLPPSCRGPLITGFQADSWWSGDPLDPGPSQSFAGQAETHDNAEPPAPLGTTGCDKLGFTPTITAQPTSRAASSPSGLDFSLDVKDEGLENPEGIAHADIEKAVVTLPQGFSVNPSIAEGLEVCTEADLQRETPFSEPGAGCPNAAKIGTVEVETPLLEENVNGSLYQAAPYQNPFHSLIALYIVIKNPTLGIIVKQPLKVLSDPVTGQLTTVAEELPQLPFSHFRLHFREGTRSPLATPPTCGTHTAVAQLFPSSGGQPITTTSAFEVISGPDSSPCPTGGLPPFHPGLIAGTLNNAAGRFSPFNVRLSRTDSEQEITHFSIKLPPGITGKLAGVPLCSDAAIQAAKERTGPHGGQEELDSPSCPAASQIGHTLAGSGVGPSLAYAPGKLYLAGPYHGSALSLVSITAAKVGPFDLGTVVVRLAFKIDPETAEVFLDATGSDPIPHIIQGIPVHLRDIRAYTDRPNFVLNPTSCKRTSTASTLLGSGLDFASEADDNPVTVATPFQAADCAALPFKPKLALKLIGGTKRGAHPKLVANLAMNGFGEAAIAKAQVTLPHSEFLENAHIKTICTRVQFKAGGGNGEQCPAASIYGHAKAITPILADPLEGPIYLRSSEHQLPDLVAAFHNGEINVDLVGRIDSVKGGGIRNTFEAVPDAPVTSATFSFQGAGKGLLVNSTDLCRGTHRAEVNLTGHNGKVYDTKPALQVKCGGKGKRQKRHRRVAG
jgi:hypothetical protein